MTISFVNSGSVALGGASLSVAAPATVSQGNLLLMFVGQKPSTANGGTLTVPAGWTQLASHLAQGGYSTTLAADTGNTNLYCLYKVADGSESSTAINVTLGTSDSAWGIILNYSKTTYSWQLASTTGQTTATPTSPMSVTFAADPGITSGDHIVTAFCIPTDVTTPAQFSAETLTATSATLAAVTEVAEPDNTTGNDTGGVICRTNCTAGTATAAPVWGSTITGTLTNLRGPHMLVRIREASGAAGSVDSAVPTDGATTIDYAAAADNLALPTDSASVAKVVTPTDSAGTVDTTDVVKVLLQVVTDSAGADDSAVAAHGLHLAEEDGGVVDSASVDKTSGGGGTAWTQTPTDNAVPTDAVTFTFGPSVTDNAVPTDAVTFAFGSSVTDVAVPTDSASVDKTGAGAVDVTDNAVPTDAAIYAQGKSISDVAVPIDVATYTQGKSISDAATPTDSISFILSFSFSDESGIDGFEQC